MTIEDFIFEMKPQAWQERGTCRVEGADPGLFILSQGQSASIGKSYCKRCPVTEECLQYGLETNSVGVWGGEVLTYRRQNPGFTVVQDGNPQKVAAPKKRRNRPTSDSPPNIAARKRTL